MTPIRILPARLAPRVQLGAALALLIVGGGAGTLLYSLHRNALVEDLRDSTTAHGSLLEQGIRHAMLDRDPRLMQSLVQSLAKEPGIEAVLLLDKLGQVRFSSDSSQVGSRLSLADATCQLCHRKAPEDRGKTAILRRADGLRVLRNVNPIRNAPPCHGCHSPQERINGVLIIDHSMAGIEARLGAVAGVFAVGTVAMLAALGAVLGLLLHRLVLRPVGRMQKAIAAVERGNLGEELEVRGGDEMSRLAEQFNRMAVSLRSTLTRLREREDYLRGIIESADDGIVVVGRDLRVVTANTAYLSLCGRRLDEVVGKTCCFAPQCGQDHAGDCPSWAAFQTERPQRTLRRIVDGSGATRTYEISSSPLLVDSAASQALEVWRDISERTRLEAELAHSERLGSVGLLAAGISHEINNPLASITTCLDGLQRRLEHEPISNAPVAEAVERYLGLIQKEVHRCRDLTGKLILLSQKSSPVYESVNLNLAIEETISLLEFEVSRRGARLDRDLAPGLPSVRGDEARLRQVVLNLLLNATEAIQDGGMIRVRTRPDGDRIHVRIADDGCGIASSDLPKIFEPFYSARSGTRGTGLGLFVANQIVRLHGGTIEVKSQAGEGTEVTVILPVDGGRAGAGLDLRAPGR